MASTQREQDPNWRHPDRTLSLCFDAVALCHFCAGFVSVVLFVFDHHHLYWLFDYLLLAPADCVKTDSPSSPLLSYSWTISQSQGDRNISQCQPQLLPLQNVIPVRHLNLQTGGSQETIMKRGLTSLSITLAKGALPTFTKGTMKYVP